MAEAGTKTGVPIRPGGKMVGVIVEVGRGVDVAEAVGETASEGVMEGSSVKDAGAGEQPASSARTNPNTGSLFVRCPPITE
jgi:hypothetical protein